MGLRIEWSWSSRRGLSSNGLRALCGPAVVTSFTAALPGCASGSMDPAQSRLIGSYRLAVACQRRSYGIEQYRAIIAWREQSMLGRHSVKVSPEKFMIARVEMRALAGRQVAAMRMAAILINWSVISLMAAMGGWKALVLVTRMEVMCNRAAGEGHLLANRMLALHTLCLKKLRPPLAEALFFWKVVTWYSSAQSNSDPQGVECANRELAACTAGLKAATRALGFGDDLDRIDVWDPTHTVDAVLERVAAATAKRRTPDNWLQNVLLSAMPQDPILAYTA